MEKKRIKLEDKWMWIDTIIKTWVQTHPEEAKIFIGEVKTLRNRLVDSKFATTKTQSMRHAATFPQSLFPMLKKHLPGFPQDDKILREFLQRYPQFQVAKKR